MKLITFGKRLTELRKAEKLSQGDVAKKLELHVAVIGLCKWDEDKASIEIATAIADAVAISLDYLAGNTDLLLDKSIINDFEEIKLLAGENKHHHFALSDTFIRDANIRNAYEQ